MTEKVTGRRRVTVNTTARKKQRQRERIRAAKKNEAGGYLKGRRIDGTFKISKVGKYNARGRWIDGHWFPSKAEADRYEQLLELQAMGKISDLETQPPFPCVVNNLKVCTYRADFRYRIRPKQLGTRVLVEEVKGVRTKDYLIKRNLMKALWPAVEIIEIEVPKRGNVQRWRYLTADQIQENLIEPAMDPRPPRRARATGGRARGEAAAGSAAE